MSPDEHIGDSQFGHLQLEYSSGDSSARATRTIPTTSGLSSTGGWSEPQSTEQASTYSKQDDPTSTNGTIHASPVAVFGLNVESPTTGEAVVPGVRSPPDGQNDDHRCSAVHHANYYSTPGATSTNFQNYSLKTASQVPQNQIPHSTSFLSSSNNPIIIPNESMWPRFSSNNFSNSSEFSSSNDQNTNDAIHNSLNDSSENNVRREVIGASHTDGNIPFNYSKNHEPADIIPLVPPDVFCNTDEVATVHSVPGAVLDLGDDRNIEVISQEVLDILSPRPVDVVASSVNFVHCISRSHSNVVTGTCNHDAEQQIEQQPPCHPDVIGVSVNDEAKELQHQIEDNRQIIDIDILPHKHAENNADLLDNVILDDNEKRLLPDLMSYSSNDCDIAVVAAYEYPEPAIVVENTLSCVRNDEPALIQENQSGNRIPEVVNIHQTCEATAGKTPIASKSNVCNFFGDTTNNINSTDIISNATVDEQPQEYVRGTVCGSGPITLAEYAVVPTEPVIFNPNEVIADIDLEAELAELEEEQAILQEAYAIQQGIAAPQHRTTSNNVGIAELVHSQEGPERAPTLANEENSGVALLDPEEATTVSDAQIYNLESDLVEVDTNINNNLVASVNSTYSDLDHPIHCLTSQMSREFDCEQASFKVDSLPRISAEICSVSAKDNATGDIVAHCISSDSLVESTITGKKSDINDVSEANEAGCATTSEAGGVAIFVTDSIPDEDNIVRGDSEQTLSALQSNEELPPTNDKGVYYFVQTIVTLFCIIYWHYIVLLAQLPLILVPSGDIDWATC